MPRCVIVWLLRLSGFNNLLRELDRRRLVKKKQGRCPGSAHHEL